METCSFNTVGWQGFMSQNLSLSMLVSRTLGFGPKRLKTWGRSILMVGKSGCDHTLWTWDISFRNGWRVWDWLGTLNRKNMGWYWKMSVRLRGLCCWVQIERIWGGLEALFLRTHTIVTKMSKCVIRQVPRMNWGHWVEWMAAKCPLILVGCKKKRDAYIHRCLCSWWFIKGSL